MIGIARRIVRRRCVEIGLMEQQEALGGLGADGVALVLEQLREPGGLARSFGIVDVALAPARVGDPDPHQPGPHDEPDDEQPPVELGVHRREV
jgi:hypothetical protein